MRRIAPFLALLFLFGCSDEHSLGSSDPVCAEIIDRCHVYDTAPGIPHDCHQFAHGNNIAMCSTRRAECLMACPLRAGDGGARDAASTGDGH